jgi:hypothetical protein
MISIPVIRFATFRPRLPLTKMNKGLNVGQVNHKKWLAIYEAAAAFGGFGVTFY